MSITTSKQRFKIQAFTNRSGTTSWRVTGTKRSGERIRENFADESEASCRRAGLEAEYYTATPEVMALKPTRLTESRIHLAEAAFNKLDGVQLDEADILRAVDAWVKNGKPESTTEAPKLDDAVKQFCDWLEKESGFRGTTRKNLKGHVNVFANSMANLPIPDINADSIYAYLEKRKVSKVSKDNERRALSRFFAWCIDRPRKWIKTNPARKETRETRISRETRPTILSLAECKKLLAESERFKGGRLAPYVAVCLFGGLRPFEAQRLKWDNVNMVDGEIQLDGWQTKTKRGRTINIVPELRGADGKLHKGPSTLLKWLEKYKGKEFFPTNWRKDFDVLKASIGYNGANRVGDEEHPEGLKPWPSDVMRHTAISHFVRLTGSYGKAAEQFGNSEGIIKAHYEGRVTSTDTEAFYKMLPKKRGAK